ncbi:MAG TPA: molybdenum cofactor guanylyltransferase [Terriglobales bacterium]|nr:molybdenum cofactor guanylyltransferase [Terriglobales bacterium]
MPEKLLSDQDSLAKRERRKAKRETKREQPTPLPISYHFPVDNVTAFVLAGGRSSRMGSDKAMLVFNGQTLLQRALQVAAAAAGKTIIVGPKPRYAPLGEVIEDIYAGCGPLSGIHAALQATGTDWNLVLSVDMPRMTSAFLSWLVQQAVATQDSITVPDVLGGPQPLCAVYHRDLRQAAEQALNAADYKIAHLFAKVATRYITEPEIIAAGFSPELFVNINTRGEYERLLAAQL